MPVFGAAVMTGSVFAGLALAEPYVLVAVLAAVGLLGALGATVRLWARCRARFRYRTSRGRHVRIVSPGDLLERLRARWRKMFAPRPRWTRKDRRWLEAEAGAVLPEATERWL